MNFVNPFLLRYLAIVLVLTANLWLCWRMFDGSSVSVIRRAVAIVYGGASILVLAGVLLQSDRVWDLTLWRAWPQLRPGMSKADVDRLLGKPVEVRFDLHFGYKLHPLVSYISGWVTFKKQGGDSLVVESFDPTEPTLSHPGLGDQLLNDLQWAILPFALAGLGLLLLFSFIPTSLASGWTSIPVYYPLLLLLCIAFYEAPQRGGWRFDWLFIMGPACFVILLAWLVRMFSIWKSTRG